MACRVGITTDLARRKTQWEHEYPFMREWKWLGTYQSKSAAQSEEIEVAKSHGCDYGAGGRGDEDQVWYVYHFHYQ